MCGWSASVYGFASIAGEKREKECLIVVMRDVFQPMIQALFKISNEAVPATKTRTFPSLEAFVGKCLIKDAALRPVAEELLKDDFLGASCEPRQLLELCDAVDKAKAAQPFNY